MYAQFNTETIAFGKRLADSAAKANHVAVASLERIVRLQFKAIEGRMAAAESFMTAAADVRDPQALTAFWPKGINFVKESAEKFYADSQEIMDVLTKTGEALGELAKAQVETTVESLGKIELPKVRGAK